MPLLGLLQVCMEVQLFPSLVPSVAELAAMAVQAYEDDAGVDNRIDKSLVGGGGGLSLPQFVCFVTRLAAR